MVVEMKTFWYLNCIFLIFNIGHVFVKPASAIPSSSIFSWHLNMYMCAAFHVGFGRKRQATKYTWQENQL